MNVQTLSSVVQSFTAALQSSPGRQAHEEDPPVFPASGGSESTTGTNQDATAVDPQQLAKAIEMVKQAITSVSDMARNLQFSIDKGTGKTVVKIIDPETQQVIQQIPSMDLLEIAKSLESSKGLLIKQQA